MKSFNRITIALTIILSLLQTFASAQTTNGVVKHNLDRLCMGAKTWNGLLSRFFVNQTFDAII